jgi:pyruvate/2-oxoglutarate dehydrogenase complex dihydrolipoamide dehydrogenase (E3) component
MPRYTYDVTIIGGGSGGLTAARLAQALGARVCLIDKERLGGDCLHYGCVPSKSLIHVARVVQQARHAAQIGLAVAELTPDMPQVTAYVQGVIERAAQAEATYTQGVDVRFGRFEFVSQHEFTLDDAPATSQSFIIATGSRPAVPAIDGLDQAGYLTNEDAFDLMRLPAALTVVGGGPIGCELAQAFARLGAKVTVVQGPERLLPKEDPEVSQAVAVALEHDGVTVITGARMRRVRRDGGRKIVVAAQGEREIEVAGDEILLALGRAPNVEGLRLEAACIAYDRKGITVDEHLQTTTKDIYAIGDVIGGYLFSHVAAYHAGVAVRNILAPIRRAKVSYDALPWVTFTDPEAARVGLTEEEALAKGPVRVVRFPYAEIDRAQADAAPFGFIKLVLGAKNDHILGAHIVGAHAGELLGELALAIKHRLGLDAIFRTIHAYPTYTTGLQQAAFEAYLESEALKNARKILRPVLAFRG